MKSRFLFVFLPIILTTLGEFILKFNLNQLNLDVSFQALGIILTSPLVMLGLSAIIFGTLLWIVAMSKFELSFLYPFLSLNYVAIIIGSQYFLGEEVSLTRYFAIFLIMVGLVVISTSPHAETKSK